MGKLSMAIGSSTNETQLDYWTNQDDEWGLEEKDEWALSEDNV